MRHRDLNPVAYGPRISSRGIGRIKSLSGSCVYYYQRHFSERGDYNQGEYLGKPCKFGSGYSYLVWSDWAHLGSSEKVWLENLRFGKGENENLVHSWDYACSRDGWSHVIWWVNLLRGESSPFDEVLVCRIHLLVTWGLDVCGGIVL